jgi:uncharacterized membrane-anchored protein YhcB (DUF1043 family)
MKIWHHWFIALLIGYAIGYYFRGLGNATLGRVKAPSGM